MSSMAREFRTGWGILLAAAIGTAINGAHFHVTGTMMSALQAAYGWSRGEIALALTIAAIVTPIVNVPVGILVDRHGPRRIVLPGILLFGLGVALFGLAGPALWTWYGAYTLFSIAVVPASVIVWFSAVVRHFRVGGGLALALALAGSGVLTAIMPSIIVALVGSYGVRGTYFALAAASVALMLPAALAFIPGDRLANEDAGHGHAGTIDRAARAHFLRDSLFWRLGLAILAISLCIGIFSVHYQPMLMDLGLTATQAASVALFTGPSFILGALGCGFLLDRIDPRLVGASIFLLPGLTSFLMLNYSASPAMNGAIGLLVGATLGAPVNLVGFSAGYYFDKQHFGFVSGVFFGVLGLAIGVGSWLAGLLFDLSGSYLPTHMLVIASALLAAALFLSVGRRRAAMAVPQ